MRRKVFLCMAVVGFALVLSAAAYASPKNPRDYHKLTQSDVLEIFQPGVIMDYKDIYMKEAVPTASLQDLQLTPEEKQKIRSMHLKIAWEKEALDDPGKWQLTGSKEVCDDLGIETKDVWVAADKTGVSQLDDYERIEAIAQNYDAIFTTPSDIAACSDVYKRIMKKTNVGFMCASPYNLDWHDPHFIGVSDADGLLAGIYSVKAAAKILDGKGVVGTIGWITGRKGALHTCQMRYEGWDAAFKNYPNIKVIQKWYDSPGNAKDLISSLLSSNPDIDLLLIDFANPPADQAQQILKERGLRPWKDIAMVTIDMDDTITVPMVREGQDKSYTAALITQTWYNAAKNLVKLYAKHVLYGDKAPRFMTSPPLPVTVYENLYTSYKMAVPANWKIPDVFKTLKGQWPLGVKSEWD